MNAVAQEDRDRLPELRHLHAAVRRHGALHLDAGRDGREARHEERLGGVDALARRVLLAGPPALVGEAGAVLDVGRPAGGVLREHARADVVPGSAGEGVAGVVVAPHVMGGPGVDDGEDPGILLLVGLVPPLVMLREDDYAGVFGPERLQAAAGPRIIGPLARHVLDEEPEVFRAVAVLIGPEFIPEDPVERARALVGGLYGGIVGFDHASERVVPARLREERVVRRPVIFEPVRRRRGVLGPDTLLAVPEAEPVANELVQIARRLHDLVAGPASFDGKALLGRVEVGGHDVPEDGAGLVAHVRVARAARIPGRPVEVAVGPEGILVVLVELELDHAEAGLHHEVPRGDVSGQGTGLEDVEERDAVVGRLGSARLAHVPGLHEDGTRVVEIVDRARLAAEHEPPGHADGLVFDGRVARCEVDVGRGRDGPRVHVRVDLARSPLQEPVQHVVEAGLERVLRRAVDDALAGVIGVGQGIERPAQKVAAVVQAHVMLFVEHHQVHRRRDEGPAAHGRIGEVRVALAGAVVDGQVELVEVGGVGRPPERRDAPGALDAGSVAVVEHEPLGGAPHGEQLGVVEPEGAVRHQVEIGQPSDVVVRVVPLEGAAVDRHVRDGDRREPVVELGLIRLLGGEPLRGSGRGMERGGKEHGASEEPEKRPGGVAAGAPPGRDPAFSQEGIEKG